MKLRERRQMKWPEVLGVDEHFFSRCHGFTEYTTVFTDLKKRKLFDMYLGKNVKNPKIYLNQHAFLFFVEYKSNTLDVFNQIRIFN